MKKAAVAMAIGVLCLNVLYCLFYFGWIAATSLSGGLIGALFCDDPAQAQAGCFSIAAKSTFWSAITHRPPFIFLLVSANAIAAVSLVWAFPKNSRKK